MWGFCVGFLFCCAVLCVLSSFAIIPLRKRELVALLLWYSELPCFCCHSLPLPNSAVGWSVLCDCGLFLVKLTISRNKAQIIPDHPVPLSAKGSFVCFLQQIM